MTTAPAPGRLYARAVERAITPPAGVELLEPRMTRATGTHDDLFLRLLALSDGETTVLIAALDLVGLDLELVAHLQEAVRTKTGMPPERLMLTTTHTHSAPVTIRWGCQAQAGRNREWEAWLAEAVAECAAQALTGLVPVSLAVGRAGVQIGYNRRLPSVEGTGMGANRFGPVAPWVDVLRLDGAAGPLALLFSHAAHAVAVHVSDTRFSADYPGYAVRTLRERLGENVVPLFLQGCAGDVNVHPVAGGLAAAERAGTLLGEAAAQAAQAAEPLAGGPLRVVNRWALLPFRPLPLAEIEAALARAREALAAKQEEGAAASALSNHRELVLWGEHMQRLAAVPGALDGLPFPVQGFAVGRDVAVLGLPHEPFVQYQLYFQQRSPFPHTLVFGYNNGCADYVPTAEALRLGGYEVQGAPKLYGWPELQPDCERIVQQTGMDVLAALWEA